METERSIVDEFIDRAGLEPGEYGPSVFPPHIVLSGIEAMREYKAQLIAGSTPPDAEKAALGIAEVSRRLP
jgi:hypothetical protein